MSPIPNMSWASLSNGNDTGPGVAYVSSTTLTDVSPIPAFTIGQTIPLLSTNQVLRVRGQGVFSTTGTPTLLVGVYYGGVAAANPLIVTGAITTGSNAAAWPFRMEAVIQVVTLGPTGTLFTRGELMFPSSLTAWASSPYPQTNAGATTVDTTSAKALTFGAQWGTSSASNTLTLQQWLVEVLN